MLIYKIQRRKLFNSSLGGNETTPNIKEENATSSICVCVCKTTFFYNLKQCVKKNQPKKPMHKIMNFVSTN